MFTLFMALCKLCNQLSVIAEKDKHLYLCVILQLCLCVLRKERCIAVVLAENASYNESFC